MKLAIVGSRKYKNEKAVRSYVNRLPRDTVIVSGGAAGPDSWAVDQAKKRGLPDPIVFPVDRVGLPPYPMGRAMFAQRAFDRNQKIIDTSDALTAFWDGKSRGTKDSISRAEAAKIPIAVVSDDEEPHVHYTDDLWLFFREGH